MTTPHTFADDFAQAQARFGLEESDREHFSELWHRNPHLAGQDQSIQTLAGLTRALRSLPGGETMPEARAGAPPTGRPNPPARLDQEGARLYRDVEARADRDQGDFFTALADISGVREYAELGPGLMTARELEDLGGAAVDPESRTTDQAARVLMRSHAIDYADAAEAVESSQQVGEAKAETGAAEVEWRDTRVREAPPTPWLDNDWERDRRRAEAAGIDITREEWEAMADEGRDYVGEVAERARRERVEELERHFARTLVGAQEREAEKRADAIERELRRRAEERLRTAR